jgi:hypothetical protein
MFPRHQSTSPTRVQALKTPGRPQFATYHVMAKSRHLGIRVLGFEV